MNNTQFMPKGIKGFQKGHIVPKYVVDAVIKYNKNKVVSDETRKKMSDSHTGKKLPPLSEEHKEKLRLSNLGRKQSKETIAKKVASRKGYRHSKETIEKIRRSNSGENSSHWKGDNVGYSALHKWVYKKLGKANICNYCESIENIDWANISREYKRDTSDWMQLCRKCHINYDKEGV